MHRFHVHMYDVSIIRVHVYFRPAPGSNTQQQHCKIVFNGRNYLSGHVLVRT